MNAMVFAILRVGAGLLFIEHGLQKLFGMFGGHTEVLLFTRPVALVLLLEMLVAFATVHVPMGGWPIQNGGELALLYALIFAVLCVHGGGPLSIDSRR